MNRTWTRRGALGLIAGGAGLLAYGSAGFTQLDADRDANVAFVEDNEAALRIVAVEDGEENILRGNGPFESGFVIEFTNQFDDAADGDGVFSGGEFNVELVQDEDDDGDVTGADAGGDVGLVDTGQEGVSFETDGPLARGETARLEVTAGGVPATFTLEVDAETDQGTEVRLTRQVAVLADEDVGDDDDDADAFVINVGGVWSFGTGQGSRGVAFEAENVRDEGGDDVVATEAQVIEAAAGGSTVTRVRNADEENGEFGELDERASNTAFIEEFFDVDDNDIDEITVGEDKANAVELDQNLVLGPGEGTKNYGLTQFRDANDDTVVMHRGGGGSATIRLVFEDGSERTYEFTGIRNQPP